MATKNTTPKEYHEQKAVVQYLERMQERGYDIIFSAIAQSTYTTSPKQKAMNKAMGVRKGLPDLFIIINNTPLFIEMKRRKGGKTSPEQEEWLQRIANTGAQAHVCFGAEEAIEAVRAVIAQTQVGLV